MPKDFEVVPRGTDGRGRTRQTAVNAPEVASKSTSRGGALAKRQSGAGGAPTSNRRRKSRPPAKPKPRSLRNRFSVEAQDKREAQQEAVLRREQLQLRARARLEGIMHNSAGAPSLYSPEVAAVICYDLSHGLTVRQAAQNAGIDVSTVYSWRLARPEFSEMLARARTASRTHGRRNHRHCRRRHE
jgi:hypothetical protein